MDTELVVAFTISPFMVAKFDASTGRVALPNAACVITNNFEDVTVLGNRSKFFSGPFGELSGYLISGWHKNADNPDEPWVQSPYKILEEHPHGLRLVIGFNDSGGDEDFNDIVVVALMLDPLYPHDEDYHN
jgi:hypothetical protein